MAALNRNKRHGSAISTIEDEAFQGLGNSLTESQPVEDPYEAPPPRMPRSVPSSSPEGQLFQQPSYQRTSVPGMQAPANTLGPTLTSMSRPTQHTGRASSAPPTPSFQARDTAGDASTLGPSLSPRPMDSRTETGGFNGRQPDLRMGPNMTSFDANNMAPLGGSGSLSQPVGIGQYNLEGYDYSRFGDPSGRGNNTWKYRIGSVMSNYDPNDPQQVNAMISDLQSKGVPLSWDGKDKITFGPEVVDENGNQIGTIDIIRGAGAPGAGWAWQPLGGAPQGGGMGMGGSMMGGDPYSQLSSLEASAMQGDTYSQRVLYYLMQQLGLDQSLMNGAMPQGQ